MLAYAIAVNMPCILAQRYNRPRFLRLLRLYDGKAKAKSTDPLANKGAAGDCPPDMPR